MAYSVKLENTGNIQQRAPLKLYFEKNHFRIWHLKKKGHC